MYWPTDASFLPWAERRNMIMRWIILLHAIGVSLLTLAGCAMTPADCDPNRPGGFVHSTSCLATGSYAERQRLLEVQRREALALNQDLRALLALLEQEQRNTARRLDQRQSEYDAIERLWRSTRQRLSERSRGNQRLATQIQAVESNIATLRQQTPSNAAEIAQKQRTLQKLRQQVAELESILAF